MPTERKHFGTDGVIPSLQVEAFYRDTCGMTDRGADDAEDGLIHFEMRPAQAATFPAATNA